MCCLWFRHRTNLSRVFYSMKKVILVESTEAMLSAEMHVECKHGELHFEVGLIGDDYDVGYIRLNLEKVKTLRKMIDEAITEMEQERS